MTLAPDGGGAGEDPHGEQLPDLDEQARRELAAFEAEAAAGASAAASGDRDDLDVAALLRSLDPSRPSLGWRLLALLALVAGAVLTVDALWRAVRHGEWIRLPGVPVAVVVAVLAASHAWERSER